jgi:hypothetical protein
LSTLAASLREGARSVARRLRAPGFYLALLLSTLLWALAYQYKIEYVVDLGGPRDDAFVTGFHAKERNADLDYRWSGPSSTVTFPAVGNQPAIVGVDLVGFRPSGEQVPVTIEARGQTRQVSAGGSRQHVDFQVERDPDSWSGDLSLHITSPTFTPPNDARRLGVIVDRVSITPAGYGLRPVVVPPLWSMLSLLSGLVLCYLIALWTLRRTGYALAGIASLSLAVAAQIVWARPELGLLAGQVVPLCAWGLALAVAGRAAMDLLVPAHSPQARFAAGAGSLAFVAAFLLRYGGATYPQFLTSDLLLHVHNVQQRVLRGEWVFPGYLPDGTPVPYPPALYVLVAPLALLLGTSDDTVALVLKWSVSVLDAAVCLALAWAAWRLRPGRAGGLAALAYALSPAPFDLLSAGNYSNLFAQAALNLTLLGGLAFLGMTDDRRQTTDDGLASRPAHNSQLATRNSQLALLTVGFFLTVLGHYGMMLAALAAMALFGAWVALAALRGKGRSTRSWSLLGAFGVALAAGYALYYWRFGAEMWAQWTGIGQRLGGGRGPDSPAASLQPGAILGKLGAKTGTLVGAVPFLGALAGAGLFGGEARNGGLPAVRGLLAAWLGASAVFALLDQALGDAIRWYYLAAAPVSLLAGLYLALLAGRRRAARLFVGLALSIALWHLLLVWVGDYIFTRYH